MGLFLKALKKADNEDIKFSEAIASKNSVLPNKELKWQLSPALVDDLTILHENLELRLEKKSNKIIAFASALGDEGVSTLASYYTWFLANRVSLKVNPRPRNTSSNSELLSKLPQVLLADFNFKNPRIHELFGLEQPQGFVEAILDNYSFNRMTKIINTSNFRILTNGRSVTNPVALFNSVRFRDLMKQVRDYFDYAILDVPPIVSHPDALSLAQHIDGVVLVVLAGITNREIIQKAKAKLQEAGLPVLGVILNRRTYYIPNFIYRRL